MLKFRKVGTGNNKIIMSERILIVLTNHDSYLSGKKTGLWLGELVHVYDALAKAGHDVDLTSPRGGKVPLDPLSTSRLFLDKLTKSYLHDDQFMGLLDKTFASNQINPNIYTAIYYAGGHGAMWDFPDDSHLLNIAGVIYQNGGVVAAMCHGCAGLLNIKAGDKFLIYGKRVTGYSWNEEVLVGRKNRVPFNLESELRKRGARYSKSLIPFVSHVISDGRLITGQNPQSAKELAKQILFAINKT